MLTISRDDFLKWCAFRIGQRLVRDELFRERINSICINFGYNNQFEVKAEDRIPFMLWSERILNNEPLNTM